VETASLVLQTVEGEGLRFHGDVNGRQAVTFDSGPGAQAPNPVEIVLAAIGACTAMDVIAILRKKRQKVTRYELSLEGDRRTEHPRIFTQVRVVHRLHGHDLNANAIAEAIRLSETKYCTVSAIVSQTAEISNRFEIVPA
jgi:putative redox protein